MAPSADVEPARFLVATVAGGVGILGFVRAFPGSLIAENQLANQQQHQRWQELVAVIAAENRSRRAAARLVVRTGEPVVADLTSR
jgi:hypothetical protein